MKAYVNAPNSLMGIKMEEAPSLIENALSGTGIGASIGSAIPVIGNIAGGIIGTISGIGVSIFGGGKDIWLDVVYKDALQEVFNSMGLKTTEPYDGKLTQRSQFHINNSISVSDMEKILNEINSKLALELGSDVARSLNQITISDRYNKELTLFSFEVLQEKNVTSPPPEKDQKVSSGKGKKSMLGIGVAGLVGILLIGSS